MSSMAEPMNHKEVNMYKDVLSQYQLDNNRGMSISGANQLDLHVGVINNPPQSQIGSSFVPHRINSQASNHPDIKQIASSHLL